MSSKSLSLPFILVSTLLTLSLGTWVLTYGLARTIGKPEQAQDLLNNSGIYQALIPQQVADAQKANPSLQSLPLDNPEVQKVLGQSLDSQKLQQQGNQVVGAIYAWLEGKSAKPQINISVAANQQDLATAAGNYAYQFAAKLPTCTPSQTDYAAFRSDPLSATCLPYGVTPSMVRTTIANDVLDNPALGQPTQVTGNDLKLWNGKTVMDSFTSAPKWYQRAEKLPLVSAAVAAVCILLLLLILGFRQGLKSAGKHLLSVGIVMALVAIGLTWLFDKFYSNFFPPVSNPNVGSALNKLSNLFDVAYRDNIVRLCAYMAIGGVALLVVAFILKLFHRTAAKPAPAASRPATSAAAASEPESLASAPTDASFTPSGPPSLPATPGASASTSDTTPNSSAPAVPATASSPSSTEPAQDAAPEMAPAAAAAKPTAKSKAKKPAAKKKTAPKKAPGKKPAARKKKS